MKLAKAMATVGGYTGLSRIAGFIRDIMMAAVLGAGPIADAFFVALKLPNFFRRVTAEGAFSVAFVPLYSEKLEKDGRECADAFASNAFMVMLSALSVFTLLAMAVMPFIIRGIAPGFEVGEVRFESAVEFSRITFPYLLLMSLTALIGGVMNALDRFAPFAFAPVLFNICLIIGLLTAGYFENAGLAMSWAIVAAGIAQLLWLYVCARRASFRLRIAMPRMNADMRKVFALMGPGVIGAGVMHINLFADMMIASLLEEGAISYLYYADRLNQLPLGVVGIAVGTALLPMLSKSLARGDAAQARDLFNRALELCLLLALPAAVALAVIPHALISGLFERGAFSAEDSRVTAVVLQCYALGLPAYIAIKVFSSAHWSRQDTKTPVKISVAATIVNIGLSLWFIQFMGVAGIALGTGLTAWMQFALHVRSLKGLDAAKLDERFKGVLFKIIISVVVMAVVLYAALSVMPHSVIGLVGLVVTGMLSYVVMVVVTGAVNVRELKGYFRKG